jgi:hypothetical protein
MTPTEAFQIVRAGNVLNYSSYLRAVSGPQLMSSLREGRESPCLSEAERCADRNHRRSPTVDGLDDLGVVDALQVDGRDTRS